MAAPDEPQMRALVEERAKLLRDATLAPSSPVPSPRPRTTASRRPTPPGRKNIRQAIT